MTDRRRHPALHSKRAAAAVSAVALVGLVGAWASADLTASAATPTTTAAPQVRVVLTDPRIDRQAAVRAALDALAQGLDRTQAPLAGTSAISAAPKVPIPAPAAPPHATTHAS